MGKTYTIVLTEEEATVLAIMRRRVAGCLSNSPRMHVETIGDKLTFAGFRYDSPELAATRALADDTIIFRDYPAPSPTLESLAERVTRLERA